MPNIYTKDIFSIDPVLKVRAAIMMNMIRALPGGDFKSFFINDFFWDIFDLIFVVQPG